MTASLLLRRLRSLTQWNNDAAQTTVTVCPTVDISCRAKGETVLLHNVSSFKPEIRPVQGMKHSDIKFLKETLATPTYLEHHICG